MVALDRVLHNYATNRLEKCLPYDRSLAITVNGPQCVGEGETKMLAHFYSLAREKESTSNQSDESSTNRRKPQPVQKHGLIGTDSDLLMMALASGVVASPESGFVRGVDPKQHDLTVSDETSKEERNCVIPTSLPRWIPPHTNTSSKILYMSL